MGIGFITKNNGTLCKSPLKTKDLHDIMGKESEVDSMDNKHKMLIELDREKIEREQIYDIEELEACIVERFAAINIYEDEKGYYSGSFVELGAIVLDLCDADWFLDNAKTWLWLTLENNTDNPTDDDYSAEDFLIQFKRFREEDKKQQMAG